MSFDSSKRCVDNLSQKQSVTLDDVLNMLNCVFSDALEHNKLDYITEFKVEEVEKIIGSLNRFSISVSSLYEEHKGSFVSENERLKQRAEAASKKLLPILAELTSMNEEIERGKKREQELEERLAELEKTRGHLLPLKDECDRLDKEIARLNDPYLDKLAEAAENKRSEVAAREAKEIKLTNELAKATENGDSIKAEIEKLECDVAKKQYEIQQATALKENLNQQKESLEKLLADSENSGSTEFKEVQAKIAVLMNVWNSYKQENDFDNVMKSKFSNIKLDDSIFDNVKSVQDIDNAVNELITVAEKATDAGLNLYRSIQSASETPAEDEQKSDNKTGGNVNE